MQWLDGIQIKHLYYCVAQYQLKLKIKFFNNLVYSIELSG